MSTPQPHPAGVELLDVRQLRLIEVATPAVSAEHQLARDRVWEDAVDANPSGLFDGPVVACSAVEWEGPRTLVVRWAPVTYRHFALRRVPGAVALASLFVAVVQPADEGGLLVGRMASATAAPGRWQLPGGSVEPPDDHDLDEAALRRHAARELAEEIGVDTPPDELILWAVTRGEHGNVGVFFSAPCRPASMLHERFAKLMLSETALGRNPELEGIAFAGSAAELAHLAGPHVDYLRPIVCEYDADPVGPVSAARAMAGRESDHHEGSIRWGRPAGDA